MTRANKKNPFQLTAAQCDALDALVEHGSAKAAAFDLGVTLRTMHNTLREARKKMDADTMLASAVKWDRLMRAGVRPANSARVSSVFDLGLRQ